MFRRHNKLSLGNRVREFLWPRSGWRRSSEYLFHRVARLPGTPYSIAAGVACGVAISFTPFVGLHFILGGLWAWTIRANIVASAIGTAAGNPWTFPFIWLWLYELGTALGVGGEGDGGGAVDFAALFGEMMQALLRFDMAYLLETAWPVWWPMFVASIPTAVVAWIAFYLPLKWTVEKYQVRRRRRNDKEDRKKA